MKKVVALLLCIMLLFCSCSKDPYEDVVIDIDTLMSDIMATQEFADPMMVISSDDEEYKGFLDQIIVAEYSSAIMSFPEVGISSDMVIIVEAYSIDDTMEIMTALANYTNERYESYMGYAPEEAKKIDNCVFMRYGKYVILFVLPDVITPQNVIDKAFNQA